MSHLQPKFIAKAKANIQRSRAPRAMPRNMIVDIACSAPCAKRKDKDPWFNMWGKYSADHRIFSLRK